MPPPPGSNGLASGKMYSISSFKQFKRIWGGGKNNAKRFLILGSNYNKCIGHNGKKKKKSSGPLVFRYRLIEVPIEKFRFFLGGGVARKGEFEAEPFSKKFGFFIHTYFSPRTSR